MVTFEAFREYCKRLDGQILQTEGRGKPFTVSVDGSSLRFIPASGKPRAASPERTEKVLDLLAKTGDWSPSRYRQITYHSSYILGVAKAKRDGVRGAPGELELEKPARATPHTNDYCEVWGRTGWRRPDGCFSPGKAKCVDTLHRMPWGCAFACRRTGGEFRERTLNTERGTRDAPSGTTFLVCGPHTQVQFQIRRQAPMNLVSLRSLTRMTSPLFQKGASRTDCTVSLSETGACLSA